MKHTVGVTRLFSEVESLIQDAKSLNRTQLCIAFAHSECTVCDNVKSWCDEILTYDNFNKMSVEEVEEQIESYFQEYSMELNTWRAGDYIMFIVHFDL